MGLKMLYHDIIVIFQTLIIFLYPIYHVLNHEFVFVKFSLECLTYSKITTLHLRFKDFNCKTTGLQVLVYLV